MRTTRPLHLWRDARGQLWALSTSIHRVETCTLVGSLPEGSTATSVEPEADGFVRCTFDRLGVVLVGAKDVG